MANPALIEFTPVAARGRHDGWSAEVQRGFVAALARGLGVGQAAQAVGMRRQGAYALRGRPDARGFAAAWDSAQRHARSERLAAIAAPAAALRHLDVATVQVRGALPPEAPSAVPPSDRERAGFSALLDRICPAPGGELAKADEADNADRADEEDGKTLDSMNIVNFTRRRFGRDGRRPRV